MIDAAALFCGWSTAGRPHARLDRLLRSLPPADAQSAARLAADSLGKRNQRLLALNAALGLPAPEAVAGCPSCGTQAEFSLPAEALLALPAPNVTVVEANGHQFRLPTMADVLSTSPLPLAQRCHADGMPVSPALAAAAAQALDAADPAADVVIDLDCSQCGAGFRAAVDIAALVADGIDRLVQGLYREIDAIARAYGWSEAAILALPAERRRRYVALAGMRA